jgi:hypothetical protein
MFRNSWNMKRTRPAFTPLVSNPDWIIRKREIPEKIPSMIHNGSKTHDGGVISGFCRPAYHVEIEGVA